jgi:tetraacyldisaccharide 4'-kinase
LREPRRRLKSVDAVVLHSTSHSSHPGVKGFAMQLDGDLAHRMTDARERQPLAAWRGQKLHAVAGLGNPNRFFVHVGALGPKVVPHPFPDHHRFTPEELDFGDGAPVLMTEKDAVKLRRHARAGWWVLPVSAKVDPAFGPWLLAKLRSWEN